MRLFIGIQLCDAVRKELMRAADGLKKTAKGNFSSAENLHITLQFLGEKDCSEVDCICRAMQKGAEGKGPVSLCLSGPGRFERGGESIVWYGIAGQTQKLRDLWQSLNDSLQQEGIIFTRSEFKPHITLGRRVKTVLPWNEVFSGMSVAKKPFDADKIALFESTRVQGVLTYIPMFIQKL